MKTTRRVRIGLVALAASLGLAACGGGGAPADSSAAGGTITVYSSGDVNVRDLWQKTLIPGFQQAQPQYKVNLVFSEHGANDVTTLARVGAAAKAGTDPGEDLLDGGFVQVATSGWSEQVSAANVPNLKNVDPKLLAPVQNGSVPYRASAVVLAYNSTMVATPPKTLDELLAWITANPGKFTYNSPNTGGSGNAFAATVLDKYVPADARAKLTTGYDASLEGSWDQGFAVLKSLTPAIYQHVYPNGNQAVVDLLAKGQIAMAPVWSDQGLSALSSGALPPTIKLAQVSDPSFTGGPAYVTIPKTAQNKAGALALANWMLEPAQQAAISTAMAGYPVIPVNLLPTDVQQRFAALDVNHLRLPYSDQANNDLKQQWQQKVPG